MSELSSISHSETVGVAPFDDEHVRLAELLQAATLAAHDHVHPQILREELSAIFAYALMHFSEEEYVMNAATDRLARLIQDLLDVSRLRLQRMPMQARPTDLAALTREAAERFGEHLDAEHALELAIRDAPLVAEVERWLQHGHVAELPERGDVRILPRGVVHDDEAHRPGAGRVAGEHLEDPVAQDQERRRVAVDRGDNPGGHKLPL